MDIKPFAKVMLWHLLSRYYMFYRVLSSPINCSVNTEYKGVYRNGPYPTEKYDKQIFDIWYEYVKVVYADSRIGVCNELSLAQLKQLAYYSEESHYSTFEIVGISEMEVNPCEYYCYGIDVASIGGYSPIGDGVFDCTINRRIDADTKKSIQYYFPLLNMHNLFKSEADADAFSVTITSINKQKQSSMFETDELHLFYVYRIWNTLCYDMKD